MLDVEIRISLIEQQLAFEKEIRVQQAQEYERRLAELNHAHAQALEVQATYLTRELYDTAHKEVIVRLDKIERLDAEQRGQYAVIALAITIGLTLLTIGVNVFLRFVH